MHEKKNLPEIEQYQHVLKSPLKIECDRCVAELRFAFSGKHASELAEEHTCKPSIYTSPLDIKKNKLFDRANRYARDVLSAVDHNHDQVTTRDAREAITAAQRLIETLSVWIALDKGEVE